MFFPRFEHKAGRAKKSKGTYEPKVRVNRRRSGELIKVDTIFSEEQ